MGMRPILKERKKSVSRDSQADFSRDRNHTVAALYSQMTSHIIGVAGTRRLRRTVTCSRIRRFSSRDKKGSPFSAVRRSISMAQCLLTMPDDIVFLSNRRENTKWEPMTKERSLKLGRNGRSKEVHPKIFSVVSLSISEIVCLPRPVATVSMTGGFRIPATRYRVRDMEDDRMPIVESVINTIYCM